jgi:hypothetical protein
MKDEAFASRINELQAAAAKGAIVTAREVLDEFTGSPWRTCSQAPLRAR